MNNLNYIRTAVKDFENLAYFADRFKENEGMGIYSGCTLPNHSHPKENDNSNKSLSKKDLFLRLTETREWTAASFYGLTDNQLKSYAKTLCKKQKLFCSCNAEGSPTFFMPRQKGGKKYQDEQRRAIIIKTRAFMEAKWEMVAVTITYDIKNLGRPRYNAWKTFPKSITKLAQAIQNKFGARYISVTEATKNQYPHAHIIFFFPPGTFIHGNKKYKSKHIKRGKLYNFIKSHLDSPVFRAERIQGENTAYYLTKYISKGSENYINQIANKKTSLTDDEKKYLACLFWTSYTHTRALRSPTNKTLEKIAATVSEETRNKIAQFKQVKTERKPMKIDLSEPEHIPGLWDKDVYEYLEKSPIVGFALLCRKYIDEWRNENIVERLKFLAGAARHYLIQLCTNSSPCLRKVIYVVSKSEIDKKIPIKNEYKPIETEADSKIAIDIIRKKGSECGCGGCFMRDLCFLILNPDVRKQNHFIISRDHTFERFFGDGYIDDDLSFMCEIADFILAAYKIIGSKMEVPKGKMKRTEYTWADCYLRKNGDYDPTTEAPEKNRIVFYVEDYKIKRRIIHEGEVQYHRPIINCFA